jgi:hypothetical protein
MVVQVNRDRMLGWNCTASDSKLMLALEVVPATEQR